MSEGKSLTIAVLSRQRDITIASTVLLLRTLAQKGFRTEIVVIDNGSTDRTVKCMIKEGK